MHFIYFGMRMKIEELFLEWCDKNWIAKTPHSMVVFMLEKGWLNEEKIYNDLKNE